MPHADFELDPTDGSVHRARRAPGGGRKPNDFVPAPEVKAYNESKARNEAAKADMNELDFKIKAGQYLERDAFREASATLLAELAQGLRGLPDKLERKFNLPANQIQLISDEIDASLAGVADGLEMFTESLPPA